MMLLLLLLFGMTLSGVRGHALWQQTVRSSNFNNDGHALTTVLTFAERPGVAQVEKEYMAKKEYDAGVSLFVKSTSYDQFEPLTQLPVALAGKFIVAPLPDTVSGFDSGNNQGAGGAYVLESSVRSGLWAEGDAAPSLSVFYTSASRYVDGQSFPPESSSNRFRIDMRRDPISEPPAVTAIVRYDGVRLPGKDVKIIDGVTGEEIFVQVTDSDGAVSFTQPPAERIFAKVKHMVDTPGAKTKEGKSYETVNNVATSILELSEALPYETFHLPDYDIDLPLMGGEEMEELSSTEMASSSTGSSSDLLMLFVGFGLGIIGSLFGVLMSTKILGPSRMYAAASAQDVIIV